MEERHRERPLPAWPAARQFVIDPRNLARAFGLPEGSRQCHSAGETWRRTEIMSMNTGKALSRAWLWASVLLFGIALACSKQANEQPAAGKVVKLAFVTNNPSDFWKIVSAGIRKYEKEAKVQVDVKMPPSGTPEEQN